MPTVELPGLDPKHADSISYCMTERNEGGPLVVYLNGLGRPSSSWDGVITSLPGVEQLAYDRPGQGSSPSSSSKSVTFPVQAAVKQLNDLLDALEVTADLILVGNSIGCALARLYTAAHPNRVKALLLLDHTMTDTDFVSLLPAAEEGEPEDVSKTREALRKAFWPGVPNAERMDRWTICDALPSSELPNLGEGPLVVVMAHDEEVTAQGAEEHLGISARLWLKHIEPAWHRYKLGLLSLSTNTHPNAIWRVAGSDHFIQLTGTKAVVEALKVVLDHVERRS